MRHSIWCRCSVRTAVNTATAMSSRSRPGPRPPFRGGRGRRGFSGRPWTAENQVAISGDSHFESVRDANLRLQGEPSYNSNSNHGNRYGVDHSGSRGGCRGQSHGPRPRSGPRFNPDSLGGARPFYGNQQQFRPPPPWQQQQQKQKPPFQPQQQHGRPKSEDYRRWEYAKNLPPSQCERFVVLSYNILADYLASSHRSKLYIHIPPFIMDWQRRRRSIVFELGLWSPDIICFQEVDKFQDLEDDLRHRGYMGTWKMRTGSPTDGCAIFWRTSRFKLVHEEVIEFNQLGLRDNVAQIGVLQSLAQNDNDNQVASTSSNAANKVVICNIHVLFNPKRGEMKLAQVRVLLEKAHAVSKAWNDAPVVICGDFNSTPQSPLYNFISDQKLDISAVDRDQVSGQESAQILPSPKRYNPSLAVNSNLQGISSLTKLEEKGGDSEPSGYCPHSQKQSNPESQMVFPLETMEHIKQQLNMIDDNQPAAVVKDVNLEANDSSIPKDNVASISLESSLEKPYADGKSLDAPSQSISVEVRHESVSDIHQEVDASEVASTLLEPNEEFEVTENIEFVKSSGPIEQLATNETNKDTELTSAMTWDEDFYSTEKLEGLSLSGLEDVGDGKDICEDSESFLSKLHGNEDVLLTDLGDDSAADFPPAFESKSLDVERATYDPSLWSPEDIAMATGNAHCCLLQHSLKLRSTYSEVEGSPETRDSSGEPQVTSYHRCFLGTVDYIWRSEGLETVRVLAPLPKHAMLWTPGFPTKKWGSDHIALASELAFTKGGGQNKVLAQPQALPGMMNDPNMGGMPPGMMNPGGQMPLPHQQAHLHHQAGLATTAAPSQAAEESSSSGWFGGWGKKKQPDSPGSESETKVLESFDSPTPVPSFEYK